MATARRRMAAIPGLLVASDAAAVRAEAAWAHGRLRAANAYFSHWVGTGTRLAGHQKPLGPAVSRHPPGRRGGQAFHGSPGAGRGLRSGETGSGSSFREPLRGPGQGAWVEEVFETGEEHLEAHLIAARMSLEMGALAPARETLRRGAAACRGPGSAAPGGLCAQCRGRSAGRHHGQRMGPRGALDYNPVFGDIYATQAHLPPDQPAFIAKPLNCCSRRFASNRICGPLMPRLGVNLLRQNRVKKPRRTWRWRIGGIPTAPGSSTPCGLIDSLRQLPGAQPHTPCRRSAGDDTAFAQGRGRGPWTPM